MAKQLMFDDEARRKIASGARKLADAVRVTLGPTGRHVLLQKAFGAPVVTKDGVTVSKEIELPDPFENVGAKLMQSVAQKTSDVAGDGTTVATVLADAIYAEGLRHLGRNVKAVALKRGIDAAVDAAAKSISEQAKKIKDRDDIARVATVSANFDEEIGATIADAMEKVGRQGVITVEEAKATGTTVDYVDGLRFDKGYISPYFMTDPKSLKAELENPLILLYDKKISALKDIVPLLEKVAQAGRSFLIVAEEVEGEALALLVLNKMRGVLKVVAVKAPGFGDRRKAMLEDIAILTGGKLLAEETGRKLDSFEIADLGRAEIVRIDKDFTTIIHGAGTKQDRDTRIAQLKAQIAQSTSQYDREKFEERMQKLAGGVAVIKVGGTTETAMKERKDRVEGALSATRAAVEEGIVPGGGVAYLRAIPAVEAVRAKGDEARGVEIVARALEVPFRDLCRNAGLDGDVMVDGAKDRKGSQGLDARTGQWVDMFKAGIVDPAKVARVALQNAASVAGLMLTTQTVITDLGDKEKNKKAVEGVVR